MLIEVWSDVACPFCYIGKRRLEEAIELFENKDSIEIIYKSYLLNPNLNPEGYLSLNDYLIKTKNWSSEYLQNANIQVESMAKEVGLDYHLDKVKLANTKHAHLLLQLAKKRHLGNELKEMFLKAYFTDGVNLGDNETVIELAIQTGLNETECRNALQSEELKSALDNDIYEAQQIGVTGVPFFVFDNKFGISGAQALEVFTRTLEQTAQASK